jgi:hypothetical protein
MAWTDECMTNCAQGITLGRLLIGSGVATLSCFQRGGPRVEDEPIRPITDVVVTESVIGSLT